MKSTIVSALVAFAASAAAWEMQLYNNTQCNVDADFASYYVYSGSGQSPCEVLKMYASDGVFCGEYLDGGEKGPITCTGGLWSPSASYAVDNSSSCTLYTNTGCSGTPLATEGTGCFSGAVQSFTCTDA